jgi:hypothetical protein
MTACVQAGKKMEVVGGEKHLDKYQIAVASTLQTLQPRLREQRFVQYHNFVIARCR